MNEQADGQHGQEKDVVIDERKTERRIIAIHAVKRAVIVDARDKSRREAMKRDFDDFIERLITPR